MANRSTSIDDPDLVDLLDGIDQGTIALPNFQRDFDWSDSDIRALLATVLNGWPMGSLLIIEGDEQTQEFYDPRAFEFAGPLRGVPELIVLDGQQRLTSLYAALYGKSASVHAVKVDSMLDWSEIDSLDSAIRTFKRDSSLRNHTNPAEEWEARLIPVRALRSSSDFYAWRDAVGGTSASDELTWIYRNHLAGLYRYRVPVLKISRETHPAAVARIFERVNKTGQQLGTFDLMVAKSFTTNFNLRVRWEQVQDDYPELADFYGDDGLPPLQVIALRIFESVRSSTVLSLTATAIHDNWDAAVKSLDRAVRFSKQHLGVIKNDWQPYKNLMIVLAAYSWSFDPDRAVQGIKNWFWGSSFTSRYAVGSNTVAVADFKRMSKSEWAPHGFHVDWPLLRDATKQSNGALHRAWLCALAMSAQRQVMDAVDRIAVSRSLLPRMETPPGESSPHLLSLGFVLEDESRQVLPGQFLSGPEEFDFHDAQSREELFPFLHSRAANLVSFLGQECGGLVDLVMVGDAEREGHTG